MPPVVNGPFGGGNGIAEKTQKEVKKKTRKLKNEPFSHRHDSFLFLRFFVS